VVIASRNKVATVVPDGDRSGHEARIQQEVDDGKERQRRDDGLEHAVGGCERLRARQPEEHV
jgi:hypothetical protein